MDEEKRKRVEELLLAIKDWADESRPFLDRAFDELSDLVIDGENVSVGPARRYHWISAFIGKTCFQIQKVSDRLPSLLIEFGDPSKYTDEVKRRADNQRKIDGGV